jgi:hypothetical protein
MAQTASKAGAIARSLGEAPPRGRARQHGFAGLFLDTSTSAQAVECRQPPQSICQEVLNRVPGISAADIARTSAWICRFSIAPVFGARSTFLGVRGFKAHCRCVTQRTMPDGQGQAATFNLVIRRKNIGSDVAARFRSLYGTAAGGFRVILDIYC